MLRDYDALVAFLDTHARTPFAWWDFDCVTCAAQGVEAQTGVDPLTPVLPRRWRTARGAARALHLVGGLAAAVDLALPRVAVGSAMRGDVGLVERLNGRQSLVLVEGDLVVGPGFDGLVRLPRAAVLVAWSAEVGQ